jgi:hypothetical protein
MDRMDRAAIIASGVVQAHGTNADGIADMSYQIAVALETVDAEFTAVTQAGIKEKTAKPLSAKAAAKAPDTAA